MKTGQSKGRTILQDLVDAGKPAPSTSEVPHARPSGAVRAMNLGLGHLSEEAAAARELRETLASGDRVVELDPGVIDASIIADRIASDSDPAYDELKAAIAANGQQVPILVRPHPDNANRYQAAYGHRRIRAARELGLKVRAVVRVLTDSELLVAQGQENGPRLDLSFIERALFADRMDQAGFDRDTVCAALGVDKSEASRLLSVAEAVQPELILAIGPAPKIGRPRWLALASSLGDVDAVSRVSEAIGEPGFAGADTNARFALIFAAAGPVAAPKKVRAKRELKAFGKRVAWLEKGGKQTRLVSEQGGFSQFLERRLPKLLSEYEASPEGAAVTGKKGGEH